MTHFGYNLEKVVLKPLCAQNAFSVSKTFRTFFFTVCAEDRFIHEDNSQQKFSISCQFSVIKYKFEWAVSSTDAEVLLRNALMNKTIFCAYSGLQHNLFHHIPWKREDLIYFFFTYFLQNASRTVSHFPAVLFLNSWQ